MSYGCKKASFTNPEEETALYLEENETDWSSSKP